MSNKRLKRTEAEFFVYKPGVVVPRDVTHILVHPSVKVLPDRVFQGLLHLKEVVLSEGLREIRKEAVKDCTSLERVDFPSSLMKIGESVFSGCTSLVTLHFLEGLLEIGGEAFLDCTSLQRIYVSSTVATIGSCAFSRCSLLRVMILANGIRTIGNVAFAGCALEDVVLSATLTEIGIYSFGMCQSLRRVKLSGGIQLINSNAFQVCDLLNHIEVTPKCLVVEKNGEDFNFGFARTIIPDTDFDRVVISSECFYSMSSEKVSALEIAITEILGMRLEWGEKHSQLCALLAIHERRRKEEVAGLLKLGVREAEMCRLGAMGPGTGEESPLTCKVDVIVGNVLVFL